MTNRGNSFVNLFSHYMSCPSLHTYMYTGLDVNSYSRLTMTSNVRKMLVPGREKSRNRILISRKNSLELNLLFLWHRSGCL